MKKMLAMLLSCVMLLTGCSLQDAADISSESAVSTAEQSTISEVETTETFISETPVSKEDEETTPTQTTANTMPLLSVDTNSEEYIESLGFNSLNDPDFQRYIEDKVYSDLVEQLNSDDYFVENVEAVYVSKEYLEEVAYNSQENIYFGYKLSELEEAFQGDKFIFTLGENGQTEVIPFEEYDDTFDKVVRNVAIGTGVILLCVTVSVVSSGVGAPAVSMIFAASAKTATTFALSSGVISGVSAGVVEGFQTHDFDSAVKAAALKGSEGFMWGAVTGAVTGGINKGIELGKDGKNVSDVISYNNSPKIGKESEQYAENFFEGREQVSYLNGKEVSLATSGATRPDIVIEKAGNAVEAIEVKNYDLVNNFSALKRELKRQVEDRVKNLPEGSTQRIALVTKDRNYTKEFTNNIVENLQEYLFDSYGGKIPVTVLD